MTTAQVVETSVTVNNNSPIQDYVHPDDQTQPTFKYGNAFPLCKHLSNLTTQTLETGILGLCVYKNVLDLFLTKEGNQI